MASTAGAAAGGEAAPELVRPAGDVDTRAPGRWTERLAVHLKDAAISAAVLIAVALVAVAINKARVSVHRIVIASALTFLLRVLTSLLAAGGLAVATVVVSIAVLIRRLSAKVRRFLPGPYDSDDLDDEEYY